MPVSHVFTCAIPDNSADAAAGKILPSHWNTAHVVDLSTGMTGNLPLANLAQIPDQTILGNDDGVDAAPQALTPAEVRTMLGLDSVGTGAVNSVTAADASLTISPTTGAVLANLNVGNANTWTAQQTFNTAAPILGTMTIGSVLFVGAAKVIQQDNANFFWDDTNNRLGIGTAAPDEPVHVKTGGDRTVMVADYTGSAASLTSGAGFVASAGGVAKAVFGWLAPTNTSPAPNSPPIGIVHAISDPLHFYTDAAKDILASTGSGGGLTERWRVLGAAGSGSVAGNMGIGVANPTATLHLKAGSSTAGTAPLKLNSGTLNGTAEVGAVEFLTDKLYGTITTGAARKELTLNDAALTSGRVPFTTTNGRITDVSTLTWNGTGLGLGGTAGTLFHMQSAAGGGTLLRNENTNTAGYASYTSFINNVQCAELTTTGSTFSPAGIFSAATTVLYGNQSGGLKLAANNAAGVINFYTNTGSTERAHIDANGNFVVSAAALATNATNGFLYIPTCAGAPSGTPTAKTGRVPIIFDTTNNRIYVYDGLATSRRGVTFASGSFQNSGWQTDQEAVGRPRKRRNYYEIRGQLYLLNDEELEYLVHKLIAEDARPKPVKKGAARLRVPKEWVPIPLEPLDWTVHKELVAEAKTKHYPVMLGFLDKYDRNDDEDVILLLYG